MKFKPALVAAATAAAATAVALGGAATASADTEVQWLGQPGELVNGTVVQHWTVSHLKPSTDTIPYQPVGTLWEATASDEAVAGNVTPIISNLNARAKNGDTYRVLFGVATTQGVNPAPLAQGHKTSGKIYFDVTGEAPDSVFYSTGDAEELLWLQAPPPAAGSGTSGSTSGSSSSGASSAPSAAAETTAPETPASTPAAEPAAVGSATPASVPSGSSGTPLPEGSSGTPLPEGSSGTPLPEGSSGTPLPANAAPPADAAPAPVPAAATPAPAAPTTTVVVPAPPA
ncbi:MPT63 family protein [Mycolicibacterium gilvum]|uniref:MPT63 family protein n=1 Tax=Mycolicibacterium gilvum TaxID=1804 RepID=UPI0040451B84